MPAAKSALKYLLEHEVDTNHANGACVEIREVSVISRKYFDNRHATFQEMLRDGGHPTDTVFVAHGTGRTDPKEVLISQEGIDRSFARPGLLGNANYFSYSNFIYSGKSYSFVDASSVRHLIFGELLTGKVDEVSQHKDPHSCRAIVRPADGGHSIRGKDFTPPYGGENVAAGDFHPDSSVFASFDNSAFNPSLLVKFSFVEELDEEEEEDDEEDDE